MYEWVVSLKLGLVLSLANFHLTQILYKRGVRHFQWRVYTSNKQRLLRKRLIQNPFR